MTVKIWIVDDDENIREALTTMSSLLGYTTRAFPSPSEAGKALAAGEMPKLVFLDINMPEISGFDLLGYVRKQDRWNSMIIIIVSSESDETLVEKAIRMGPDGYVFKPINFDELKNSIRTASRRRNTRIN